MPEQLKFIVPEQYDGICAKRFLKEYCSLSTRMITSLKRKNEGILMNGKILRTIDPVFEGQQVIVNLPDEASEFITPVDRELDVIYEDSFLLIVNKPPYVPVHPVKQYQTDTIANYVMAYSKKRGEQYVFRAINRLDRNTSGLVMIAKDRFTVNKLKNRVDKTYYALVEGEVKNGGTVCAPIGLREDSKIVRHVIDEGAPAVTHYDVINSTKEISLLKLWLETGKTHQIRCHMAYLGHPLLGDDLYGGKRDIIQRHALHCEKMVFNHPVTNEQIELIAKEPDDFKYALNMIYPKKS